MRDKAVDEKPRELPGLKENEGLIIYNEPIQIKRAVFFPLLSSS